MSVIAIKGSQAESDYKGCGKVWAAIKDGKIVALRYMSDFAFNRRNLPAWVIACLDRSSYLFQDGDISHLGGKGMADFKAAAVDAGHPEYGVKGGHIRPSVIAREAHRILSNAQRDQFESYRAKCRADMSKLGDVVSGMASSYELVVRY